LVFENLAAHLAIPLQCENGGLVVPRMVAIDSSAFTQEIYSFVRDNAIRRLEHGLQEIMAVKGSSTWSSPAIGRPTEQDIDLRGRKVARGVKLWPVGSSTIKQSLYAWLRVEVPGPHYIHFSEELPEIFFDQLSAEKLQTRYLKGHPVQEWHLPAGRRNEMLDCFVYCVAGAHRMGLPQFREPQWQQQRTQRAQIARPDAATPARGAQQLGRPASSMPNTPGAAGQPAQPPRILAPGFGKPPGLPNWVTSWRR
jgi:phage terminase large subunit GpA-like protein